MPCRESLRQTRLAQGAIDFANYGLESARGTARAVRRPRAADGNHDTSHEREMVRVFLAAEILTRVQYTPKYSTCTYSTFLWGAVHEFDEILRKLDRRAGHGRCLTLLATVLQSSDICFELLVQ